MARRKTSKLPAVGRFLVARIGANQGMGRFMECRSSYAPKGFSSEKEAQAAIEEECDSPHVDTSNSYLVMEVTNRTKLRVRVEYDNS